MNICYIEIHSYENGIKCSRKNNYVDVRNYIDVNRIYFLIPLQMLQCQFL